jgi:pimeloyl-ACP methyl ester carboxylesterase
MKSIRLAAMLTIMLAGATAGAVESTVGRATSADGTEIVYEVRGEGTPELVFIHGWSCDRGYWCEQVDVFAEKHRVVAIDLAGHGESAAGRQEYTVEAFGADVAAVLVDAKVTDAILVGHSMGGPVAVEAALREPDRVRGIVGVDNFQSFVREIPTEQASAFIDGLEENFAPMVNGWVKGMFPVQADQELRDEIAADMAAGDPAVGISAMRNILPWMGGGGADRVRQLKVNITTVSSDMHPTDVEANQELVPDFEVRVMKGVGHFPMLEAPAEFNELLAAAVGD